MVVDAKDERARDFYLRHDSIPLPSQPSRLLYSVKTIEAAISERERTRKALVRWLAR
jgi:hypothetical protein